MRTFKALTVSSIICALMIAASSRGVAQEPSQAQSPCSRADLEMADHTLLNQANDTSPRQQYTQDTLVAALNKCGSEPTLELFLATFLVRRSQAASTTPAEAERDLHEAWLAFQRGDNSGGQLPNHLVEVSADMRLAMMKAMVVLSDNHNGAIPAFSSKDPLGFCPAYAGSMAQALRLDYEDKLTGYAPAYIAKLAEACPAKTGSSYSNPEIQNALTLVAMAKGAANPAAALTLNRKARASLNTWLKDDIDNIKEYGRHDIEAVLVSQAKAEIRSGLTLTAMFDGNLESEVDRLYMRELVALSAAARWNGAGRMSSDKEAQTAQLKSFHAYVQELNAAALAKGPAAQTVMVDGLDAFATGRYNPNTNPKFMAPPDVIWRLLRPK